MPMNWGEFSGGWLNLPALCAQFSALTRHRHVELWPATGWSAAAFVPPAATIAAGLSGGFSSARRSLGQQGGNDHEVVGEHRRADKQGEALGALGAVALHAATAHQHRDAPLDAGAKALALLECCRPLVGLALRRLAGAALWNADRRDGAVHARRYVLLAEEAAVRRIEFRGPTEAAAVTLERRRHMNVVRGVSLEHLILGDQTFGAFGEEHLVAEFHGRAHLAALDQVGLRLEDRIDFLGIGHLLAFEHAAARLVDDTRAESAIMRDLVADGVDRHGGKQVLAAHPGGVLACGSGVRHHLLGDADQRSVGRGLPRSGALALLRRHALNLVHAPPRRA